MSKRLMFSQGCGDGDVNWYALLISIIRDVSSDEALMAMDIYPKRESQGLKGDPITPWLSRNRDERIWAYHDAGKTWGEIAAMEKTSMRTVRSVLERRPFREKQIQIEEQIFAAHKARVPRNEIIEKFGTSEGSVAQVIKRLEDRKKRKEVSP